MLPTIAPDLDYGELAIGDGNAASGAWRELYHSETPIERCAELRVALAEYCGSLGIPGVKYLSKNNYLCSFLLHCNTLL